MADGFVKRPRFYVNERLEAPDMNRLADDPLAALVLAMQFGLSPAGSMGIVRGLRLIVTAPTSLLCTLTPGAAIAPNGGSAGLAVVESDRAIGPFDANASGQDRIDRVSIKYVEAVGALENRTYELPDTSTNVTPTNTRMIANPLVTITKGNPGSPPGAPATPAGEIAIADVLIRNGSATIETTDITESATQRFSPLRTGRIAVDVNTQLPVPWVSGAMLSLAIPDGARCILTGSAMALPAPAGVAGGFQPLARIRLEIQSVSNPIVPDGLGGYDLQPMWAFNGAVTRCRLRAQTTLIGPIAETEYQLRVTKDFSAGQTDWSDVRLGSVNEPYVELTALLF